MTESDHEIEIINAVEQRLGIVAHDIDTLGETLDVTEFPVLVSGFSTLEKLRIFDSEFVAAVTGNEPVFDTRGVDPKRWISMIGAFGESTDNHFAFASVVEKPSHDEVKLRKGFRFVGAEDTLWVVELSDFIMNGRSGGTGNCQIRKFGSCGMQIVSDADAVLKAIEKQASK